MPQPNASLGVDPQAVGVRAAVRKNFGHRRKPLLQISGPAPGGIEEFRQFRTCGLRLLECADRAGQAVFAVITVAAEGTARPGAGA